MSGVRKLQLKMEVLRALNQISPQAMPENTLQTTLRILISPVPLLSEMREAMNEMEGQHLIVGVRSDMADLIKWTVTDSGKAKFAELAG